MDISDDIEIDDQDIYDAYLGGEWDLDGVIILIDRR